MRTSIEAEEIILKPAEFKVYRGAPQRFHADYRASYRKDAALEGRSQLQNWFRKYNELG
jgi:carboxymethylenebutenolidase